MKIMKVNSSTFDVFWNTGWEWWARFSRETNGTLKQIAGKSMPTKLFQQFRSIVNKKGKRRQVLHSHQRKTSTSNS